MLKPIQSEGRNRSQRNQRKGPKATNQAGAGCLIPFGLVFGGMGLFAFLAFAKSFADDVATRSWVETPAQLISCEIIAEKKRDENPFRLDVEYEYNHEGRNFTSTKYTRQEQWTDDYEKLALTRKGFREGDGSVVCYVNPENPSESVMKLKSLWEGLFLFLPLIFVLIGGGLVWAGIVSLRKKKRIAAGKAIPISAKAKSRNGKAGKIAGAFFFFVFFAVGLGVLFPIGINPYRKSKDAENWVETPCKIIWSRVLSHDSDDGTTYSVDIFYEYEFNGETHRSNRYKFMGGSSSGRRSKSAVVRRYPQGSEQICYVDPELPERAVIKRDGIGYWFLIPLVFMLVGLFGGIGMLLSGFRKKSPPGIRTLADTEPASTATADLSPKTYYPAKSRKAAVIGLAIFSLFWNGIVSVFVVAILGDLKSGKFGLFDLLPILFLIPFVLIGLAVIGFFFHQLLGLLNPKVEITLTPGEPRLGDNVRLSWKLSGSSSRLRSLKIILTGTEAATYQRGTNTHTSREVFYADVLFSDTNTLAFYQGNLEFRIPFDLMYSFDSGNNKIEWKIEVQGVIKPGPDIDDSCAVEIFPASE